MGTIYFEGLEYKEVKSDTGRIWLDRNLGAKRVSNSFDDSETYCNNYNIKKIKFPEGYRLPTTQEWEEEINFWNSRDIYGGFQSWLKLPTTGSIKSSSVGGLDIEAHGMYLCNPILGTISLNLYFNASSYFIDSWRYNCAARLIKDQ